MARIKYAPGVDPIFGQIEGFVFQSNSYGQTMKSKPKMRTWKSTVQKLRNAYFTTANNNWKNMTIGSRTAWNNFANVHPQPTHHNPAKFLNGYNLFVQRNYFKFLAEYQNFTFMDVPVFTSPLNDTFTAVAKLNADVLTLEFTFTRGDSTLQCLMNVSKTNYPSLHYIGSGTRYVGSILNTNQSVDITDQYLSFYGQLPAEGDFIYVGLTQNSLVGGQTYFSAPVLVGVTPGAVPVKFGYLYNLYTTTNILNMFAPGWRLPSQTDFLLLRTALAALGLNWDGSVTLGTVTNNKQGKCICSSDYWDFYMNPPTVGNPGYPDKINASTMTIRPGGWRTNVGAFAYLNTRSAHISSTLYSVNRVYFFSADYNQEYYRRVTAPFTFGFSVIAVKDSPGTPNFSAGVYTGNDGRTYPTVVFNELEFTITALAETKYQDNSDIPTITGAGLWAADRTGAKCAYDNDESNV